MFNLRRGKERGGVLVMMGSFIDKEVSSFWSAFHGPEVRRRRASRPPFSRRRFLQTSQLTSDFSIF